MFTVCLYPKYWQSYRTLRIICYYLTCYYKCITLATFPFGMLNELS